MRSTHQASCKHRYGARTVHVRTSSQPLNLLSSCPSLAVMRATASAASASLLAATLATRASALALRRRQYHTNQTHRSTHAQHTLKHQQNRTHMCISRAIIFNKGAVAHHPRKPPTHTPTPALRTRALGLMQKQTRARGTRAHVTVPSTHLLLGDGVLKRPHLGQVVRQLVLEVAQQAAVHSLVYARTRGGG
jgi:hypothetical protein